ncbi:MAG: type II toxin-antitoxin system VapC family toxin [Bryobacteraceae bacterium]
MKLLLDTNVFLKWMNGEKLPKRAMSRVENASPLFISMVTPWEIAIKSNRSPKLKLPDSEQVLKGIDAMGARLLPITTKHTALLYSLPAHHNDPFDRMIIAQALAEDSSVVSSDERFPLYKSAGLQLLWE